MINPDQRTLFKHATEQFYQRKPLRRFSEHFLDHNWRYVQGKTEGNYKIGNVGFMLNHLRDSHGSLDPMFFEQAALETLLHADASAKGAKDVATFKRGAAILGLELTNKKLAAGKLADAGYEFGRAQTMQPDLFVPQPDGRMTSRFKPAQKWLDKLQTHPDVFNQPEFQQGVTKGCGQPYNDAKQHFMRTGGGNEFNRVRYPSDVTPPIRQRVKDGLYARLSRFVPWLDK